jgi:uridylate kinase
LRSKPQRILLKLSGELLAGESGHGIDDDVLTVIAEEVRDVARARRAGRHRARRRQTSSAGWPGARVAWTASAADHMGMLATVNQQPVAAARAREARAVHSA